MSRNLPKLPRKLEIIVGYCLAHSRRRFVNLVPNFPEPCRYVLENLAEVYGYDAQTEELGLSPQERQASGGLDAVELRPDPGPVWRRSRFWVAIPFLKYNACLWPKAIDSGQTIHAFGMGPKRCYTTLLLHRGKSPASRTTRERFHLA